MIVSNARLKAKTSAAADLEAYQQVIREYANVRSTRKITGRIKSLDCHLEAITLMTPSQRRGFALAVAQRIADCEAHEARVRSH